MSCHLHRLNSDICQSSHVPRPVPPLPASVIHDTRLHQMKQNDFTTTGVPGKASTPQSKFDTDGSLFAYPFLYRSLQHYIYTRSYLFRSPSDVSQTQEFNPEQVQRYLDRFLSGVSGAVHPCKTQLATHPPPPAYTTNTLVSTPLPVSQRCPSSPVRIEMASAVRSGGALQAGDDNPFSPVS